MRWHECKRSSPLLAALRGLLDNAAMGHDDADDDATGARVPPRRELLAWVGAGALLAGVPARAAALACIARPQQTEGPFFVDERLTRSDIRGDPATGRVSPGAPLELTLAVASLVDGACAPLRGAIVEVWQCDAAGRYSDVRDFAGSTAGQRFLRGNQITDAEGVVRFVTIVPGWYEGRAVHIHFAIDTQGDGRRRRRFTSQLYFDDAFLDRVHAQPPYAARGARRLRNGDDGIFRAGGPELVLDVQQGRAPLAARFAVGLTL